jgi:hypothetical protein
MAPQNFAPVNFQPPQGPYQDPNQDPNQDPSDSDSDEEDPNNVTNNSVVAPLVHGIAANKPLTARENAEGENNDGIGLGVNKTEKNGPMPTMPGKSYEELGGGRGGIPMNEIYKGKIVFYVTPRPMAAAKILKSITRKDGARKITVAGDLMGKSGLMGEDKSRASRKISPRKSEQNLPIEDVKVSGKGDSD